MNRVPHQVLWLAIVVLASACGTTKKSATELVSSNSGKVRVLLLGMPGCPGTENATPFITKYGKNAPENVMVARLDVPPAGGKLAKATNLTADLNYAIDYKRKLANKLDFFFYPTLYVLDRDGVVRFSGGVEPQMVKKMVREILAEKAGSPKKIYTPPLPAVGSLITDASLPTLTGETVKLSETATKKANVIVFSATHCPFSKKAVESLKSTLSKFKNATATIINIGQDTETIRNYYAKKANGYQVLVDSNKHLSSGAFKVSAVPFYFILDKDLKVLARGPYTTGHVSTDLGKLLGVCVEDNPTLGGG